jgi:hypothetical protein
MYGFALERIEGLEAGFRAAGMTPPPGVTGFHTAPFAGPNGAFSWSAAFNFFALVFCLMLGTAALPHILMRYFTTPSVREARPRSPGRCSSSSCSTSRRPPTPPSASSRSTRRSSASRSPPCPNGSRTGRSCRPTACHG